MQCFKCSAPLGVPQHVNEKIGLLGEEQAEMYCDECAVCYLCYQSAPKGMVRCRLCGYHWHRGGCGDVPGRPSVCEKCARVCLDADYLALVGPEIPALERTVEETDRQLVKRITDLVRKTSPAARPAEGISEVVLEGVRMAPQFSSPYPEEYTKHPTLHLCGGCLAYFSSELALARHKRKCRHVFPPGQLLYLDMDNVAIFLVEGQRRKAYCQSLCMLAKMFLNHKTLYYDVEPFLFYLVGEVRDKQFIMQGYFSKEIEAGANNLSCIVVLPPYRKLGLGSFMIDFSYHLTRTTSSPPYVAGPEQPLSEDGERAYLAYWKDSIARYVLCKRHLPSAKETLAVISEATGISEESLKKAYHGLSVSFGKQPLFSDFLTNREKVKKTRRLIKTALINEEPAAGSSSQ